MPGGQWDMTPKCHDGKEAPFTLPAASSCLHCHTSDAQIPEEGTENKYGSPLFAHGGITCERYHGDDSRASIARVLEFNPDLTLAHDMLRQLQSGEVKCDGTQPSID